MRIVVVQKFVLNDYDVRDIVLSAVEDAVMRGDIDLEMQASDSETSIDFEVG